jgi:hypothetical protein
LSGTVQPANVSGLYRPVFDVVGQPEVIVLVIGAANAMDSSVRHIRNTTAYPRFAMHCVPPRVADINAAIHSLAGDYVAFVDASLEVIHDRWLQAFIAFAQQRDIGAVGGKVVYADGRLRHIGLLVGVGGGVARPSHLQPGTSYGYFSNAIGVRNYSAVSGEWMMTPRGLFLELGGFDEKLPWRGADIEYCLQAQARGRRIVYTPEAIARVRAEAAPPPALPDAETIAIIRARHPAVFARDPYYNSNLDPRSQGYQIADDRDGYETHDNTGPSVE